MTPLRITICGARGRMGKMVAACLADDPAAAVAAEVDLGDDLDRAVAGCDVAIDFSAPAATVHLARCCARAGKAAVIGTTGLTEQQVGALRAAAAAVPMVCAPNYSVGVNLLFWLAGRAANLLGPEFDLEVVEMHHRLKKDAPSGTAKRLAEILAAARGLSYGEHVRHGREGLVGERPAAEIGVHAIRGGDVVGDHTAIFATVGERLELTHKASSREPFARGAIRAAKWVGVVGRAPALYDMGDVLGLK